MDTVKRSRGWPKGREHKLESKLRMRESALRRCERTRRALEMLSAAERAGVRLGADEVEKASAADQGAA